jgi:hypothetical protein
MPMDSLITAAARALAAGDPLGALKRVALRDDAPALALRGIAMAHIIVVGLMTGPSLMYGWMMTAALNEPSTTYAVLSALMWPAVPFYITLNSAMELALVSLLVFWNWEADWRRRVLILVGVTAYFAMRVWTYLVFAELRLDIARHTLSPADVEWFKQTLAADFRPVLNVITFICLIVAALVPPWPASSRLSTTARAKQVALQSR